MSAERWRRLSESLIVAGYEDARVTEKPYSQSTYGRVEHGVSRSITIRRGSHTVAILDSFGRGDQWAGYQVFLEDVDDIVLHHRPGIKTRDVVIAAVRDALEMVPA